MLSISISILSTLKDTLRVLDDGWKLRNFCLFVWIQLSEFKCIILVILNHSVFQRLILKRADTLI